MRRAVSKRKEEKKTTEMDEDEDEGHDSLVGPAGPVPALSSSGMIYKIRLVGSRTSHFIRFDLIFIRWFIEIPGMHLTKDGVLQDSVWDSFCFLVAKTEDEENCDFFYMDLTFPSDGVHMVC